MTQTRNDIQLLISEIKSTINDYEKIVPNAMICTKQLQEFLSIVLNFRNKLNDLNINYVSWTKKDQINEMLGNKADDLAVREIIQNSLKQLSIRCEDMKLLLQLCHRLIWPGVSMELNLSSLFSGIRTFLQYFFEQFIKIRLIDPETEEQNISRQSTKEDLDQLKQIFASTKKEAVKNSDLYHKCLKTIDNLYSEYQVGPPTEPTELLETDYLACSRSWEYDLSKLELVQNEIISKLNSFSISLYRSLDSQSSKDSVPLQILRMSITNSNGLEESEITKMRRLMILSTLRNQFLIKCLGGVIKSNNPHVPKQFEIIYESPSITTFFTIRSEQYNATNLTRIAFYIASGLQYLERRQIVHGHISSYNIFIKDGLSPILWNFGLPTPMDPARRPPEYITNHEYTTMSDVYQYGLLLWELAMSKDAYYEYSNDQLDHLITDIEERKKYFVIDRKQVSPKLAELISDILFAEKPEDRPTFVDISQRFFTGEIYYINPEDPRGEEHYIKRAQEFALSLKSVEIKKILRSINNKGESQNPLFTLFQSLGIALNEASFQESNLKEIVLSKTKEICEFVKNQLFSYSKQQTGFKYLRSLIDMGLFNILTPNLFTHENKDALIGMYISLSQPSDPQDQDCIELSNYFVLNFLNNGGIELLTQAILDTNKDNEKLLSQLIDGMLNALPAKACVALLPHAIETKHLTIACKLVNKGGKICAINVLAHKLPRLSELLKEEDQMVEASILIQNYLTLVDNPVDIQNVSVSDIIKSGNISLLRTLMKYTIYLDSIMMKDCLFIIQTLLDEKTKPEQFDCALLLALGLGSQFYQSFANFNKLIDIVIKHQNQQLASRFIARLCRFPNACSYIISVYIPFLVEHRTSPFYLVALSRIAGFYPSIVSGDTTIREAILDNIKNMNQIEATVRLLGTLSRIPSFWRDGKVVESLISLLSSNAVTPFETILLLSVLSNVTSYCDMKKYLFIFISLGSADTEISGIACRIISQLANPSNSDKLTNKALRALISICKKNIEEGDEFSRQSCSKIILNMIISQPTIREVLRKQGMHTTIAKSAFNENNPFIFIEMMEALNQIDTTNIPITSLFDQMQIKAELRLPKRFYTLRQIMCNPDFAET